MASSVKVKSSKSKAGPSKSQSRSSSPQKKSMIDDEALSGSESESDGGSMDSDAIDEEEVAPKPTPAKEKVRRGAPLPLYSAPNGMEPVPVSTSFKTSPFEFDALANKKGVELWAIRVPADFKPSRLSTMALDRPSKKGVKGRLERGGKTYTLANASEEGEGLGAEMIGMNLFVPSMKQGGKLLRAPIKISRRLVLTPSEEKSSGEAYVAPPKVERTQPEHKLKFRNKAVGFETPGPSGEQVDLPAESGSEKGEASEAEEENVAYTPTAPVEALPESPKVKVKSPKKDKADKADKAEKKAEKEKRKKRKSEEETPKKKKRVKADA